LSSTEREVELDGLAGRQREEVDMREEQCARVELDRINRTLAS
jgi:hypothetical protein